ncbi:MAG: hypothetical protein C4586_08875 [Anaerolineaceae bacterium]|nr:MAG: hypothetical protein C4586_08875 [Anaerolineaceae bacterium]
MGISNQIGSNFYLVLFIQCVPGYEESICQALSSFFSKSEDNIFFSFSEYDIVVLINLENEEPEIPTKFSHPKIRDFQQVICYSHEDTKHVFSNDTALTITLLKFDEYFVTEKAIEIEEVARNLVNPALIDAKKQGIHSALLGTLGWPEAIYIQSGNNLQLLLNSVARIADRGMQFGNLQMCHTIPCVKRSTKGDPGKLSVEKVEGDVANWRIAISCRPHTEFNLEKEIANLIKTINGESLLNVFATFGRRDLLITPNVIAKHETKKLNEVLEVLIALRSTYSGDIISTHTDIGIDIIDYSSGNIENILVDKEHKKREVRLAEAFNGLDDKIKLFSEWEKNRENITLRQTSQLTQMVFRLRAIAATPGLESIVSDMYEFISAAVRKARNQVKRISPLLVSEENRKTYSELEEMENVYFFGLEQRIAGARLGLGHPSQAYSNLQGLGIQRILRASRAVPFGLLKGMQDEIAEKWWGFTIFGYRNNTFTIPSGVINLPYQDMLHPEDWWRLGHESGHAFGMITELLDNPILKDTIDNLDKKLVWDLLEIEPSQLVDELAVSVFEYLYCYRGNLDLYIETTWNFFDDLLEGSHNVTMLKQYLLRAVFVFFFHLQINGIIKSRERVEEVFSRGINRKTLFDGDISRSLKERAFAEEHSIEDLITNSLMDNIYNEVNKIRFSLRQVNIKEIVSAYKEVEFLRSDFADLFESYMKGNRKPSDLISVNLEDRLKFLGDQLNKGKIITNLENEDIFLIPLSLQYMKKRDGKMPISQRARITAILSLWHADRKWHHKIYEAKAKLL